MSKVEFPLISQIGLSVHEAEYCSHRKCAETHVRASDLEALLAKAPVVTGQKLHIHDAEEREWAFTERPDSNDTHTALLVNVQPFVRDTAEGLLRELIDSYDGVDRDVDRRKLIERARNLVKISGAADLINETAERARKLLGEEG